MSTPTNTPARNTKVMNRFDLTSRLIKKLEHEEAVQSRPEGSRRVDPGVFGQAVAGEHGEHDLHHRRARGQVVRIAGRRCRHRCRVPPGVVLGPAAIRQAQRDQSVAGRQADGGSGQHVAQLGLRANGDEPHQRVHAVDVLVQARHANPKAPRHLGKREPGQPDLVGYGLGLLDDARRREPRPRHRAGRDRRCRGTR